MILMWLSFFIEILILTILKPFISNNIEVGVIVILLHCIFVVITFISNKSKYRMVYILAFSLRVMILFFDLFGRDIFILPHSGADSEMFYRTSMVISNDLSLLGDTRGGRYSDIMGILFYLIGPHRIIGQYLNVLLGLNVIYIMEKITAEFNLKKEIEIIVLAITAFFPTSIIMSGINLREIFPTFFVTFSLYYFIRWFKDPRLTYFIVSFILLGLASTFHSGVIGIALGYAFSFLFYRSESDNFHFSLKTVGAFLVITILFMIGNTFFSEYIFGKFQKVEDFQDIIVKANPLGMGGAAYLTGVTINNSLDFLIFTPIKSIYFLFSPMPWDWRGVNDIFSFFTDSVLYIISIFSYFFNKDKLGKKRKLAFLILIMIIASSFVFGVGVSNAGTAMRHRQKLVSLFIILFALVWEEKTKSKL